MDFGHTVAAFVGATLGAAADPVSLLLAIVVFKIGTTRDRLAWGVIVAIALKLIFVFLVSRDRSNATQWRFALASVASFFIHYGIVMLAVAMLKDTMIGRAWRKDADKPAE